MSLIFRLTCQCLTLTKDLISLIIGNPCSEVKVIPSPTYAEAAPQVAYSGTSPMLQQQQ